MSTQNYYSAINKKLTNQNNDLSQQNDGLNEDILLTNDINHYYDTNIRKYYRGNDDITTKTRIIDMYQDSYEYKNKLSLVLLDYSYFIFFIIILFIVLELAFKFENKRNYLYLGFVAFIIYTIYVYYKFTYTNVILGDIRKRQFGIDNRNTLLTSALSTLLPNYMTQNQCPKGCEINKMPQYNDN